MTTHIIPLCVFLFYGMELIGWIVSRPQNFVVLDWPFVSESVFNTFFEHPGFDVLLQS
jgi:hypothetical protein